MDDRGTARYWRAVAKLHLNQRDGLAELEETFRTGAAPEEPDLLGFRPGRMLATTVGGAVDAVAPALARLYIPWRGKTFTPGGGRNVLDPRARALVRLSLPGYRDLQTDESGNLTAFAFTSSVGPSTFDARRQVLRIDYRRRPENQVWPVRNVVDELVQLDDGLYLGQALLFWRGWLRRAAWFSLHA